MTAQVRIFDTTLRDGEQSPGATLDGPSRLEIARQLADLGVDIIEAGFPAASPGDLEAVRDIARHVGHADGPVIAGLARAVTADIDTCWEAVRHAHRPRIHTFIATSQVHMQHKLHMSPEDVLCTVVRMVQHARSLCEDVQFSAEDATRSEVSFLSEIFAAALEAGASTLNIPDTVGYAQPPEFADLVSEIAAGVPGSAGRVLSVHCHDDLGMAVANSIAGVEAGARQVECTINGLGERAGNAALEEIVMALRTRRDRYPFTTDIDTTGLTRTSHLVAARTGISVPPNKAIVGGNAFAHEAGIHQDGMIKHRRTYEIMDPADVGLAKSTLVLGKHSGRHAVRLHLEELGCARISEAELDRVFARFKQVADHKQTVSDAELEALVADEVHQPEAFFALHGVHVSCGAPSIPSASVSIALPCGRHETRAANGNGPVEAIFSAIDAVVEMDTELCGYAVHAVGGGVDTLGQVTVRIRTRGDDTHMFSGHGADTDILVASAKAYLAALNKLAVNRRSESTQHSPSQEEAA